MKLKAWLDFNRKFFARRDLVFIIKNFFPQYWSFGGQESIFLDEEKLCRLEELKCRYVKGQPAAYILGKEEFFGLEFKVNSCVLIPRPETELIVEKALEIIKNNGLNCILDLCCGSGNIGIALKKFLPGKVSVFASDISLSALSVAADNCRRHKVDLKLINADLFEGFKPRFFDVIVSNPPYVESDMIDSFLEYEPRIALEAGLAGLDYIKKVLNRGYLYLKRGGFLLIEMGYNHKLAVSRIIKDLGVYDIIEWIKDYSGQWRGAVLRADYRL